MIFHPDRAPISSSKPPAKSADFRPPGDWPVQELGLYYLKSRYYDPEVCRFINADKLHKEGETVNATDDANNLITDPAACYSKAYSFFIGYFVVTPTN